MTYPNESRAIETAIVDDVPCHDRNVHCGRRRIIYRRSLLNRRNTGHVAPAEHRSQRVYVRRNCVPVSILDARDRGFESRTAVTVSARGRSSRDSASGGVAPRETLDFVGQRDKSEPISDRDRRGKIDRRDRQQCNTITDPAALNSLSTR